MIICDLPSRRLQVLRLADKISIQISISNFAQYLGCCPSIDFGVLAHTAARTRYHIWRVRPPVQGTIQILGPWPKYCMRGRPS